MFEQFLVHNNIDFNKLDIDSITLNKIKKYMKMAYECFYSTKINKELTNNSDELIKFCLNEKLEIINNYYSTNFYGFLLAFSIELNLKIIYILEEYNKIKFENLKNYDSDQELCDICFKKVRNESKGHNEVKSKFNNKDVYIPKNNNGHYLISILNNISNKAIIDLIKYETILAPFKTSYINNKLSNKEEYVEAPDLITMLRNIDYKDIIKNANKNFLDLSDSFEKMRYSEKKEDPKNIEFLSSFAIASNMVLCDVLRDHLYTKEDLNNYLSKISSGNKIIYDYICNDKNEYFNEFNEIKNNNPNDYYTLISKFSMSELIGIIKNYNEIKQQTNYISFKEFIKYYIFFKKYINSNEFYYNNNMTSNINNLFLEIRKTNDLSKLGNQFINWFNDVDIFKLSKQEIKLIQSIDPIYIYNSLSYNDKIVWKKCEEHNIKYEFYYKLFSNNLDFIIKNFSKFFIGKSIELSHFTYIKRDSEYSKEELEKMLFLSQKYDIDFKDIAKSYKSLLENEMLEIIALSKNLNTPFNETIEYYKEKDLNNIYALKKIATENGEELKTIFDCYKTYNLEILDSIVLTSKEFNVSFESAQIIALFLSEEETNKTLDFSKKYNISFDEALSFPKKYSNEEITKMINLSKKYNIDLHSVYMAFELCKEEDRIDLFDLFDSSLELLMLLTNFQYEYTIEELKEALKICSEANISIAYYIMSYNEYSKEEIYKIAQISKNNNLRFDACFDFYLKHGEQQLLYIIKMSKKLKLSYIELTDLIENNVDISNLNALSKINEKNFKFNSKMKILTLEELLINLELIGYENISNCIFYKTPEEIRYIKNLCKNNKIHFRKEFLYFDMEKCSDNKFLIRANDIIASQISEVTSFDEIKKIEKKVEELKEKPKVIKIGKLKKR